MKFSFVDLYELATNKLDGLVEVWDEMVGNGSLNLKFVRPFNDLEVDFIVHLRVPFRKSVSHLLSWIKSFGKGLLGVVLK